jgi:hypothetical protein
LDTDDIQELATPTNKYFTDARARGAISLTVTGNSGASTYSSGTGVLNVPTYTLAGLGGITATFLSGTSGISYNSTTGVISYSGTVYTDASIRALLSGSTGISYNSTTGAISYSGTVYTDASVRALISLTTTGTSGASTYNNTTGVINVPNYTLAGLGGISLTSLSGGTGITYNNTTGAISYSGTVYTDASVRALISATGSVSYNNTTGVISLSGGNLTEATSSVLTITGGTGAVLGAGTSIQVKQASSTVSGFLSSTDWATFNGKATISSGTTNYVSKFTSSTAIGNSLIYDNGSQVSFGTTTPTHLFEIYKNTSSTTAGVYPVINIDNPNANGYSSLYFSQSGVIKAGFDYNNAAIRLDIVSVGDIRFITNASERMRILSNGNIGILTSSPLSSLDVRAASAIMGNYQTIQAFSTDSAGINLGGGISLGGFYTSTTSIAQFASIVGRKENTTSGNYDGYLSFGTNANTIGVTERLRITSSGNVGINITNPGAVLPSGLGWTTTPSKTRVLVINATDGVGNSGVFIRQSDNGTGLDLWSDNYYGDSYIDNRWDNAVGKIVFRLRTSGTAITPMSIISSGNILMGTQTDNGERLYVSGAIRATGTITANSDLTLKKNLLKIENALEKVEQINGYTYQFKGDDSKRHAGVIAQEIQTVLPEIVNKGNDGILGVEYGNISALLIEAIKEQNTKIKNLETLLASK